jgi:hypothetical protein
MADTDVATPFAPPTIPTGTDDDGNAIETDIESYMGQQTQQPGLPAGTTQVYTPVEDAPEEYIDPALADVPDVPGQYTFPNEQETALKEAFPPALPFDASSEQQNNWQAQWDAAQANLDQFYTDEQAKETAAAESIQAAQGVGITVTDNQLAELLDIDATTYEAMAAEGIQGTVTPESTLRYQLGELMDDIDAGNATWADAAMRKADSIMLRRGLGASSMAGAAISQAILEAAIPIAQFDATVYGAMDLQNLRNRQEAMLSTTAAENASRQFNAKTQNEVDQFMAGLRNAVLKLNVEQLNAMEKVNVEQENATRMFYNNMQNETEKFEAQNALIIAQSNAEWRRTLNLANTAGENAAMQTNTANRFNISQQAMANLWQQQRDLFNWAMTTAESDRDRAFQIMYHNLEREDFLQDLSREQRAALSNKLARLAMGIIDDINFGDVFGGGSDDNDDGGYTYDPYNLGPHDDEDEDTIPGG